MDDHSCSSYRMDVQDHDPPSSFPLHASLPFPSLATHLLPQVPHHSLTLLLCASGHLERCGSLPRPYLSPLAKSFPLICQ